MAQVLPGRLGRLQEAETRRLELEEAKRQEILEKAEKKKHEADLARQAREAADLQREAEAMERATSLRTRWDQADRRAAKEKKAVQRAASARISKWEKRRDKATLGLCPETLFDRLRRQMEEDGLVPKPEEPAAVKKAPPRTRKPWSRPSSARVLPKPRACTLARLSCVVMSPLSSRKQLSTQGPRVGVRSHGSWNEAGRHS